MDDRICTKLRTRLAMTPRRGPGRGLPRPLRLEIAQYAVARCAEGAAITEVAAGVARGGRLAALFAGRAQACRRSRSLRVERRRGPPSSTSRSPRCANGTRIALVLGIASL